VVGMRASWNRFNSREWNRTKVGLEINPHDTGLETKYINRRRQTLTSMNQRYDAIAFFTHQSLLVPKEPSFRGL